MVKKTLTRKKSSKRQKTKHTRRVRHARRVTRRVRRLRHARRRRNLKGGGVDETTLERLYPDVPRIIASIKNNPLYADALNNSDGSNEDNFRIIYNVLTQQIAEYSQNALENIRRARENRQRPPLKPTLEVSWRDSDGVPKSSTFNLDYRGGLDISMPNKAQDRFTIYTPDAPQVQQQNMV
jgi:hypothetical protein